MGYCSQSVDGLGLLVRVASNHLAETQQQLQRRPGDKVLEQRVKRLTKAGEDLLDANAPCTWSIGNMEVHRALTDWKLKFKLIVSREMAKSSPELAKLDEAGLKDWLWREIWGAVTGGGGDHGLRAVVGGGGDERSTRGSGALLFHCHGVLNKNCFFGHFALIFGVAEGEEHEDSKSNKPFRRVLTARSYQGPRHWVDLDKVYKWIFQLKFPGYEIVHARR